MKPYEKFLTFGPEALSDAEILAILIRTGTKEFSATEIAEKLLKGIGEKEQTLQGLRSLTVSELMDYPGIGEVKAVRLKCMLELSARLSSPEKTRLLCDDPEKVAGAYMEQLRHLPRERVILLLLDNRLRLIREVLISVGTASTSVLSPRDIFSEALRGSAVRTILIHNHPAGDPEPSEADIQITSRLVRCGELLGIEFVDHLIIGDGRYVSMKKQGYF
ncbi:MAG: DNA repair protein RadC [Lachnospiraceae bacterium]|nr:DNA repair protein RadC [Lachnospiraceae bacterium]